MTQTSNKIAIHAYVSGRVQGVYYRSSIKKKAQELNIKGWIKNLIDGRVEVFACGEETQVMKLYQYLWKGPLLAKITDVTYEKKPVVEKENFDIVC